MTDSKISELPDSGQVKIGDVIPVVRGGGSTSKVKAGDVFDVTGTSYTLLAAHHNGMIRTLNAGAVSFLLPDNVPVNTFVTILQKGTGQVTFTPAGGASLQNARGHTKTALQWSVVTLFVESNSGGSSAVYVLAGDSA